MNIEGHYYLGKILKPFGTKGELLAYFDVDDTGSYEQLDVVILLLGGNLVPFLVDNIKPRHNNQVQIKLQDVYDVEQTEILIGCSMYLPIDALPKLAADQFYYHDIVGYEVIDKEFGSIGTVEQVLDYPMQALLQVQKEGKEILIPVADDIIGAVDKKNRILHITAPGGLIEMYLE